MKVLLTGGAGFIGSNVADAYIEAGHEVVILDNLFTGKRENINPKARFYLMDVRSPEVAKVFEYERPDMVNHHAAQMSVPASVADPAFDADVNVRGLLNVLEAARKNGTRKVIFISSGGAVYGEAREFPTSESCYPEPASPYAITKYVSEKYLAFYKRQYGLDYTALRYANVYGPRQVPHGEAGVVAIFMERLLTGSPCTVNSFNDEPRGMTRDYCFVGDVARANLLALDKGSAQAYNIGTGVATHTLDLFNTIYLAIKSRAAISSELERPEKGEARPGDLRQSCLKAEKARAGLGWTPEVGLAQGISMTLDWRAGRPLQKI
ncbi:MAG TPA: UDP-glucose 4-epimerase [Deltaproteobacteria bacterium]|nr:MAG: UDP-glucose 4-epimerase [Deltaproteobacteria bacterium GWA2_55_82]OGQ62018.1 MAG: UDP-glucose 4-epimerase [Deltaproteobacteria bacterium RIFCSPLOWO2_02_FULL_55_12]OIJ74126.1 MAG: UDP-glucose 4-epimerase [Deltaproteobacteria bacterium GWC2_55_46]HBG46740.1 UDP-glucose 4-epimerase [Deltaproteobacteria bacterium]HCY11251.1 UDP-glucose 4-epimerase [Deltaproteobacteria bacterium]